jgi:hypothetical protein
MEMKRRRKMINKKDVQVGSRVLISNPANFDFREVKNVKVAQVFKEGFSYTDTKSKLGFAYFAWADYIVPTTEQVAQGRVAVCAECCAQLAIVDGKPVRCGCRANKIKLSDVKVGCQYLVSELGRPQ